MNAGHCYVCLFVNGSWFIYIVYNEEFLSEAQVTVFAAWLIGMALL